MPVTHIDASSAGAAVPLSKGFSAAQQSPHYMHRAELEQEEVAMRHHRANKHGSGAPGSPAAPPCVVPPSPAGSSTDAFAPFF